jgi:hypothetical protein
MRLVTKVATERPQVSDYCAFEGAFGPGYGAVASESSHYEPE